MSNFLETVSGKMINVLNPDPADIDIKDISWSLSRMPRFCGATIPYIPYSVGQHSIQVMKELSQHGPRIMMLGLLHDSAEYLISDIPSPVKHIPGFREKIVEIEENILAAILKALDIEPATKEENELVHQADMTQRAIEAYQFMYSRGKTWNLPPVSFEKLQEFEEPIISTKVYDLFLMHFNNLKQLMEKPNGVQSNEIQPN